MIPAAAKSEFFGGPADGDKRMGSPRTWFRVVGTPGDHVHEYRRAGQAMEYVGLVDERVAQHIQLLRPGTER
jgi:hypothetical protein